MNTMTIEINDASRIPKYQQVVDSVVTKINKGLYDYGTRLPSINEMSNELYLSRDTVEKAYKKLKKDNYIESVKGKGYYVSKSRTKQKKKIFFLVNKLSSYKMIVYNSFVNSIGDFGSVELFVYHCDENLFLNYMNENLGKFDYYVVMSHFKGNNNEYLKYTSKSLEVLSKIRSDQLVVLDNNIDLDGDHASVYQDFKNDIYLSLMTAKNKILQYDKLTIVYPKKTAYPYPKSILMGFVKFCNNVGINFEIMEVILDDIVLKKNNAYIVIDETDLINILKNLKENNLLPGKDVGILSYNDTPLKELLGISVVTTSFKAIGETASYMIKKSKFDKINNVFSYIERSSL